MDEDNGEHMDTRLVLGLQEEAHVADADCPLQAYQSPGQEVAVQSESDVSEISQDQQVQGEVVINQSTKVAGHQIHVTGDYKVFQGQVNIYQSSPGQNETGSFSSLQEATEMQHGASVSGAAASPSTSSGLAEPDPVLHRCHQELSSHYLDTLCKIPLYPGDMTECVELKDIYTKVSININLPKPCRAIKIPLSSLHEMFTRKTDDGRFYTKLLISAPAGFGKTTTTAKIAYDWSVPDQGNKGSPLADVCLLFVINMRWVDHTSDLENVIMAQLLPLDTKLTKEVLRSRLEELGDRVIIILDAVDESDRELFKHPKTCRSVVKLLTGKILTSCRLVVTSRPVRVPEIVNACKTYTRLDITGFSQEDIKTYIRQFFKHDQSLGESLVKYVEQHAIIAEVCVVPLMCLLICIYWKQAHKDAIPNRIGELYDAIFEIMYEHMQSKKAVNEGNGNQEDSDLGIIIQHLGRMALDGLWPPENRLVFSVDEVSNSVALEEACQMGLIAREEGHRRGRLKVRAAKYSTESGGVAKSSTESKSDGVVKLLGWLGLKAKEEGRRRGRLKVLAAKASMESGGVAKSSTESKSGGVVKLTFFHKSAQEKCAGEYLANLVDSNLEEFQSRLEYLTTIEDALSIQLVLRFACGKNCEAAYRILQRLVEIFGNVSLVRDFYRERLDLDDTMKLQEFLDSCLSCNYEADCKDRFDLLLQHLFPEGQIYFLGMSSSTAIALGYFMEHSQAGAIKSLRLRLIAHAGDIIEPVGPLSKHRTQSQRGVNQMPVHKVRDICQEYFERYQGSVHYHNERLMEASPAVTLAFIQTWQACQHLSTAEETNVGPIIDALQYTQLEQLDITGFKISSNIDQFVEGCEKGYMSHLLKLNVSNIGMLGHQSERLAKAIQHMPDLREIDMSYNEGRNSLDHLTETITAVKCLEELHVNQMQSSAEAMQLFAQRFPQFGSQLLELSMSGNYMNDIVAAHLEINLPQAKHLQVLWIGVNGLSRKHHNLLVLKMGHLKSLQTLMIYHSEYPDDLLVDAAYVIESLSNLQRLVLHVDADTSPQVSSTSWQLFKAKLQNAVELKQLYLSHIALERNDFEQFVSICREKQLTEVRYDIICIPDDVAVPQDDMFEFD